MSTPAIRVQNLSKIFRLGNRHSGGFRDFLVSRFRREAKSEASNEQNSVHVALSDISFEVQEGESVGLIGCNGSGKSTLLKILSRIMIPTSGFAETRGSVRGLLEVGTGFHAELTGRENIFLNGTILGLRRREIESQFDEIVEFAEIGKFLNVPVKFYSSGMYMRLAFSVAAHLRPDILLVDEVLAVGDLLFQKKCLGRMNEAIRNGRTVIFVSHNLGAVQNLCSRCLVLSKGKLIADAPCSEAIDRYLASLQVERTSLRHFSPVPDRPIQILSMAVETDGGLPSPIELGQDLTLMVEYVLRKELADVSLAVLISRDDASLLYSFDCDNDVSLRERRSTGLYRARVALPTSLLKEGSYSIALKIGCGKENLTDESNVISFQIQNTKLDLTHRSYRSDRPGWMYRNLDWKTQLVGPPP